VLCLIVVALGGALYRLQSKCDVLIPMWCLVVEFVCGERVDGFKSIAVMSVGGSSDIA
jgi:hypothetical protein